MRIFIAIRPDKKTIAYLKSLLNETENNFEKARFTYPGNYHITLKFIGETDKTTLNKIIDAVKKTAQKHNGFNINTKGTGTFKKRSKYIFFCSIEESPELLMIHGTLQSELEKNGIDIPEEKYIPHITLARDVVLKEKQTINPIRKTEIKVGSIHVMKSMQINGKLTYIPEYSAYLKGVIDE